MQPRWSLILIIAAAVAMGLADVLKIVTATAPVETHQWLGTVAAFGFAFIVLVALRSGSVEIYGRTRWLFGALAITIAVLASTLLLFNVWTVIRQAGRG